MNRPRPTTLTGGLCIAVLGLWMLLRRRRGRHVAGSDRPGPAGDDRADAARQRRDAARVGSRDAHRRDHRARGHLPPRATDDAVVAGVCAGLAPSFGVDAIVLRIAFLALAAAGGAGLALYAARSDRDAVAAARRDGASARAAPPGMARDRRRRAARR